MRSIPTPLPGYRLTGLLVLLLSALSGCATLNEKECINGDWQAIGFEDGARGAAASRIGQHREACAEYGIKPDLAAYNAGRADGLRSYCQPASGYNTGLKGSRYQGVCPPDLEPGFLMGYKFGHEIHQLESQIRKLGQEIKKVEKALDELTEQQTQAEAELVSNGVSTPRRVELLAQLRELGKEQGRLDNILKTQVQDQARLQGQVDVLLSESPY